MKQYLKFAAVSLLCLITLSITNVNAQEVDTTSHHQMMNKNNMNMINNNMMDSSHTKMMNNNMMNGSHMMNMADSNRMQMMDSTSSNMMGNHKMHNMKDGKMKKMAKNPIIHKGVIDLMSIDKNKDGKVYQDMMDFNVISDKPGKCPLCGMTLKEVTINQAKKNLVDHNYKVK